MSWDSIDKAFDHLKNSAPKHWDNYLGFYSSWLGGYFKEPWAMLMPLDDHGFHRGDGVFEAARVHQRAYIDLDAHLKRLENSSAAIGMKLPMPTSEIKSVCLELARRVDQDFAALRLYVTRGPGGFSPSPAEVTGHQIYAVLTKFKPPAEKFYTEGASAMFSSVRAKDAFWSQIKSCNYLQNVMMKKECLEQGYDFAVCMDEAGRLTEGSTENLLLVTKDREIVVPKFDYTLRGTTVLEVMKIADELVRKGQIRAVRLADVRAEDLLQASEVAFVGTTLGVLPVSSVGKQPVGSGGVGPVATFLHQRLMEKMSSDHSLRSAF
jgi:4-amino-4-deoxychorismate lyase